MLLNKPDSSSIFLFLKKNPSYIFLFLKKNPYSYIYIGISLAYYGIYHVHLLCSRLIES